MWSLYYSIQQKIVRYYSSFNRNVWKKTNGDRNYLKQQKSFEFMLFWSQFSSSVPIMVKSLIINVAQHTPHNRVSDTFTHVTPNTINDVAKLELKVDPASRSPSLVAHTRSVAMLYVIPQSFKSIL